jgi:prepilin-type N-terminal cleavage/methylation domain-containing protein
VHGGTFNGAWRDERGYTLTEVLLVCSIGSVVLAAVIVFIAHSLQQNNVTAGRIDALDRTTAGIDRMQRELRQAYDILPHKATASASSSIDALVYVQASPASAVSTTQHTVRYDCDNAGTVAGTHRCTRQDVTAGTAATTVLDGLTNDPGDVFTLIPATAPAVIQSVRLNLQVRISGANHPLTLASSVTPRNCLDGYPTGATSCTG